MLSLYVTAGFPESALTTKIVTACDKAGVDFIELGMPFSDPIADGPTIQKATQVALKQGVNIEKILQMVEEIRQESEIPIILMGYLNPVFQYGFERFFNDCARVGVDGLILPDWPLEESEAFLPMLDSLNLDLIYLMAPNTKRERTLRIDQLTRSFIYCTAYTGVTGGNASWAEQTEIFLRNLQTTLKNPFFVGFGVQSREDFQFYTQFAAGVIVGSAFIRFLERCDRQNLEAEVKRFVNHFLQ